MGRIFELVILSLFAKCVEIILVLHDINVAPENEEFKIYLVKKVTKLSRLFTEKVFHVPKIHSVAVNI